MIKLNRNEEFKELKIEHPLQQKYAISNQGRIVSYKDNLLEGNELKGGMVEGFKIFKYSRTVDGKRKSKNYLVYKLVAQYFLPNDDPSKTMVLHLDYNKLNDRVENLRWANREEQVAHHMKNPLVIAGKAKTVAHNIKADGRKLTSTQVIRIKKMLQRKDNKTRLVMIAKQFNITTQQLYRIRTGENWGHIKV